MNLNVRQWLKTIAARYGVGVTDSQRLAFLEAAAPAGPELMRLFIDGLGLANEQTSQLGQEMVALMHSGVKRGGYFVEFGATDGVSLSNTLMLEKRFGWTGILAEPARCWHSSLAANRAVAIDTDCVWTTTGATLEFNMTDAGELSTIATFSDSDGHRQSRANGDRYDVRTVSLNDLLARHNAPRYIDYLSIDTEGSEYSILSGFDFTRHRFGLITCEHNYTPERDKIHSLLAAQGYERMLTGLSKWDDWYFGDRTKTHE